MDSTIFADKYICLVLCCNRAFYNERRDKNRETFNILKDANFTIVYLYADNSVDSLRIINIAANTYNMIVPSPEIYELLSHKMNIAYDYFSKIPIKGILKIDDNTTISFPDIIEHDFLHLLDSYDYIGLEKVTVKKDEVPYIKLNNRNNIPLLRNIYNKLDIDISYFGGPFYYLSPKALKTICEIGLIFSYEDLAVGYAVCKNKLLKSYLWNFKNKGISWDNSKEHGV